MIRPKQSALQLAPICAVILIAFAANSVLNRMALVSGDTGPAAFAALRILSGAAMLVFLVMRGKGGAKRLATGLRWQNAAALATYVLGFSFAYVTLDAGLGALILFGVIQITMFAGSILAREAVPPRRWLGAGLAFFGLVWLLLPSGSSAPPLAGAAMMTVAAIGWGIFSLQGRGAKDPLAITAGSFTLAIIPGLAVLVVTGLDGINAQGAALAVASGAITSGLGYALWYRLLPQIESSIAAVLQLTVPVIVMVGGMIFLNEAMTLRLVIATLLVLGGVALAVTAPSAPARQA